MLERHFGYKPPIPKFQQKQYESALHGIRRWQNGKWADNVYETDMDHVTRMFFILSEITKSCLTLSSEIDIKTVEHMIYIHDAGEIHEKVGDLARDRDDYELVYDTWKSREHAAFRLLTQGIENPDTKSQARELYKRCVTKKENDKESQLTDLIDKLQATRFGFEHVFNGKSLTEKEKQARIDLAAQLLLRPTTTLLKIVSGNTQSDLKYFLRNEFARFAQCGYRNEIANLNAIL